VEVAQERHGCDPRADLAPERDLFHLSCDIRHRQDLRCRDRKGHPTVRFFRVEGEGEYPVSSGSVSSWGQRRGIARDDSANVISTTIDRLFD
jgi:hypothetical protein